MNDSTMQTVVLWLRQDNENLFTSNKKQFEEISSLNSKILLLEQVNQQVKKKEIENNNVFLDQIMHLK